MSSSRSPLAAALGNGGGRGTGKVGSSSMPDFPPGTGHSQPQPVLLPSVSGRLLFLPAAPGAEFPAPLSPSLDPPEP